jgi:hypothetical protein
MQIGRRVQHIGHFTRDLLGLQIRSNLYPDGEELTLFLSTRHIVHMMITLSFPLLHHDHLLQATLLHHTSQGEIALNLLSSSHNEIDCLFTSTLYRLDLFSFLICRLGGDHP